MTTIERDEHGQIIVSDDISLVYGCGDTLGEAIHDYVTSLQEYFQILSRHSDRPTQRLLAYLQSCLS
jgi:hypothetical protein